LKKDKFMQKVMILNSNKVFYIKFRFKNQTKKSLCFKNISYHLNLINLIKFIKEISTQCAKCKNRGERKNHYKIFSHFKSFNFFSVLIIKNVITSKITKTAQIPKTIKEICQVFKLSKLITKYANIQKNAVKNAMEYVFKSSKYNFIFSIYKIIPKNLKTS